LPNFLPSRQVREETGRARSMRVEVGKPSLKVRVPARDAPFFPMESRMRLIGRNLVNKRHVMMVIIYGVDIRGKGLKRH